MSHMVQGPLPPMNTFTSELDWKEQVAYTDMLSKLTKKDIVAFANKYFGDNYVCILKRKGEDKNIVKVESHPLPRLKQTVMHSLICKAGE